MNNNKPDLYEEYASNFARGKDFCPPLQYSIYRDLYHGRLPSDQEASILDLGCGKGEWLSWLQLQGYTNLAGVDWSNDVIRYGPDGVSLHQENVFDFLRNAERSFDVIHAKDLIEHLEVPQAIEFCRLIKERLNPGGRIWLITFNAQAPFSSSTRFSDLTHRIGLTPGSAAQLMNASGFVKVSIEGIHPCPDTVKGRLRKILYRPMEMGSRFILNLRHGAQEGFSSCDPDLFISGLNP